MVSLPVLWFGIKEELLSPYSVSSFSLSELGRSIRGLIQKDFFLICLVAVCSQSEGLDIALSYYQYYFDDEIQKATLFGIVISDSTTAFSIMNIASLLASVLGSLPSGISTI